MYGVEWTESDTCLMQYCVGVGMTDSVHWEMQQGQGTGDFVCSVRVGVVIDDAVKWRLSQGRKGMEWNGV